MVRLTLDESTVLLIDLLRKDANIQGRSFSRQEAVRSGIYNELRARGYTPEELQKRIYTS